MIGDTRPPNPSLLSAAARDGMSLRLRIETDPFDRSGGDSAPIVTLGVDMTSLSTDQLDWLTSCVGRPFEAEHWPDQAGWAEIDFYVDYLADPVTVAGRWSAVERFGRNETDLVFLVQYLQGCATSYFGELVALEASNRREASRLHTYLEHEIDNAKRKAEYFSAKDPGRARVEASRCEVFGRLQVLLEERDRSGVA
jgi:hypothetical protein